MMEWSAVCTVVGDKMKVVVKTLTGEMTFEMAGNSSFAQIRQKVQMVIQVTGIREGNYNLQHADEKAIRNDIRNPLQKDLVHGDLEDVMVPEVVGEKMSDDSMDVLLSVRQKVNEGCNERDVRNDEGESLNDGGNFWGPLRVGRSRNRKRTKSRRRKGNDSVISAPVSWQKRLPEQLHVHTKWRYLIRGSLTDHFYHF